MNAVFAKLPKESIETLREWSYFYDWERENEVRWMTSYSTTTEDVERLIDGIKLSISG